MPPGGYPHTYILQYKPDSAEWSDTNSTVTVNISASFLSFTLTGLLKLTVYTVRLASQNINGISEFSRDVRFGTFGETQCNVCDMICRATVCM